MSANKIAETSTSTGAGDFTLDGAWQQAGTFNTGNKSFNSFYGLNHYFPYMIQDASGNWEKGIGYLSAANVLVRDYVIENSAGTAVQLNFATGSKLVMVPSDAGAQWPLAISATQLIKGANLRGNTPGTLTMAANRIYLSPILIKRPILVSAIAVEVSTAAASTLLRAGIYSTSVINLATPKLSLLGQGTISAGTASSKEITVPARLGAGYYFIALVSDGAPTVRTLTAHLEDAGWTTALTSTQHNGWSIDVAGASAQLPGVIASALTGLGSGVSVFHALKGQLQ